MATPHTLDVCNKYLFKNPEKELPKIMHDKLLRVRFAYSHWYEFPMKSELEMRNHLMDDFGITRYVAWEDLSIVKILLGNIKAVSKEWHRFTVIEMIKESYELARIKQDPKAMILAADKIGKYTQLHLPDIDPIPYDDIVPQTFEPSSDPELVGLKPIDDLVGRIKFLKDKFSAEIDSNVVDIVHTEIPKTEDEK